MRPWALAVPLMLPLLAGPGFGQAAPSGPSILTWGATLAAVMQTYPTAHCFVEATELWDWQCILRDRTVNGIHVDVVVYGYATGDATGMVGVALGFASGDVHAIVDTLVARYGSWSWVADEGFVTKADERVPSTVWVWHGPRVEIRVEQHRGTLARGQATVMWRDGLAELCVRARMQPKRDEDAGRVRRERR
jgi:hypothetical protein